MQKRIIPFLMLTMSLALIGVIGLQAYWLHKAYETRRTQFNAQVNEALGDVARQLEAQEIAKPMLEEAFANDKGNTVKVTARSFPKQHRMVVINSTGKAQATVMQENVEVTSDTAAVIHGKGHQQISRIISITTNSDGVMHAETTTTRQAIAAAGLNTLVNLDNNRLQLKIRHIEETSKKLVKEMLEQQEPVKKKIRTAIIDSLLQGALQNKGIAMPYKMGVITGTDSLLVPGQDTANMAALKRSPHRALLYPNDLLGNKTRLLLLFPQEGRHLWAGIAWMAVASALLTVFILLCFAASVRIIIRQKKIGEIRNDFINNMTHEFKTPLTTISLAADTLQNPLLEGDNEQLHHYATIIKGESKRLQSHVETILQMALTDRTDMPLPLTCCSLHAIAKDTIQSLQLQLVQRNGHIQMVFDAMNDKVMLPAVHMSNVLFNLLDNAIKYSPLSPDISVHTENKGTHIVLSVTDKGLGIPKELQKQVFEKFYRVPTGNIHNVKGFGLGLSYVKKIVERMHGNISLQSEVRKGSTFCITLPLASPGEL